MNSPETQPELSDHACALLALRDDLEAIAIIAAQAHRKAALLGIEIEPTAAGICDETSELLGTIELKLEDELS